MLEFIDYSSRRGRIVPLLMQVYSLLKELAKKDKHYGQDPPEVFTTWRHKHASELLDINRRFIFALETDNRGRHVVGFLFYRHGDDNALYIEDMQLSLAKRGEATIAAGLLAKLEYDVKAKEASIYGSERLRKMTDKEILAEVGFVESFPHGYEPLGTLKEAVGALTQRYSKTKVKP